MRLFARALVVAGLASLVLAGVALAAARDVDAASTHQEMQFLAQYERLDASTPDAPPPPTDAEMRDAQRSADAAFLAMALQSPADALITRSTQRQFAESLAATGFIPAAYFGPFANPSDLFGATANVTGSPVDVIVG